MNLLRIHFEEEISVLTQVHALKGVFVIFEIVTKIPCEALVACRREVRRWRQRERGSAVREWLPCKNLHCVCLAAEKSNNDERRGLVHAPGLDSSLSSLWLSLSLSRRCLTLALIALSINQ